MAPHTDDGELGCAGTVARLIEEGNRIYQIAFSICEDSVPEGFPKEILGVELRNATKILGIKSNDLFVKNYPVRKFNSFRQEILEELVYIRKTINPDVIFMPSSLSLHQDHKIIYEEGIRAFKHHTCLGYDLPWDTIQFPTTAFFKLENRHVKTKWESIFEYKTQKFRTYVDEDFIFGLARVRGAQIATEYAEAFELIRIIF